MIMFKYLNVSSVFWFFDYTVGQVITRKKEEEKGFTALISAPLTTKCLLMEIQVLMNIVSSTQFILPL